MYIRDSKQKMLDQAAANLGNKWWRLHNLYHITLKEGGKKVLFAPNQHQRHMFRDRHNRNIILKARQLGMTTYETLEMLDDCLFGENAICGLIAHTKQDAAKIFRRKVQFAYQHLPEWVHKIHRGALATKNEAGWIIFENGSSFYVSNSMRSDSITHLHVSEFGKICAKDLSKADEIVAGAMQAVQQDQQVTIESTAEGPTGHFFDYCNMAMMTERQGRHLTNMDWKFFFFPWFAEATYKQKDWRHVTIPADLEAYFARIKKERGIELNLPQKAWYTKQLETFCRGIEITQQGWDKMRQEFPSYPEEAFSRTLEGAYYAQEMSVIDREGRIGNVPHNPYIPVDTWWDLGHTDSTAIWFTQTIGRKIHVIDYYENSLQGLPHYYEMLKQKARDLRYSYGRTVAPHDIEVHDLSHGMTRKAMARQHGVNFETAKRGSLADGIEATRQILYACWFDESRCGQGLTSLRTYQRGKDAVSGDWKDTPKKGKANHGADAFRTMAVMHSFDRETDAGLPAIDEISAAAWT